MGIHPPPGGKPGRQRTTETGREYIRIIKPGQKARQTAGSCLWPVTT
jgi:hypothetical protein